MQNVKRSVAQLVFSDPCPKPRLIRIFHAFPKLFSRKRDGMTPPRVQIASTFLRAVIFLTRSIIIHSNIVVRGGGHELEKKVFEASFSLMSLVVVHA